MQRRCYWLLQEDQQHIVLVHYLNCLPNIRGGGGAPARRRRGSASQKVGPPPPPPFPFACAAPAHALYAQEHKACLLGTREAA